MGTGASQQNAPSKGVPKRTNASAASAASTDIASASLDAKLEEASARLKGRAKEASLEAAGAGTIDTKVQTRAAVSQGATQPHTSPWRSNNAARFADREYERRHHKRERAPELEAPAPVLLASPRKEQLDVVNELHAILLGVSRERQANREKQSAQTTPQVAVASIPQLSPPSSSSSSLVSFQKRLVAVANAANQQSLSSRDAARCACTASLLAALLTRDDKSANKLLHDGKFPPRGDDSPSTLPSEVVLLLVDVDYAYYHAHVASLVNSVSMLDAVRKAMEQLDVEGIRRALRRTALRQSHANSHGAEAHGAEARILLANARQLCASLEHQKRVLAAGPRLDALRAAVHVALQEGLRPREAQRRVWDTLFDDTFRSAIDRIDLPVVAVCSSVAAQVAERDGADADADSGLKIAAAAMLDASDLIAARADGRFVVGDFGGPLGSSDWLDNPTFAISLVHDRTKDGAPPCGPFQVTITACDHPCTPQGDQNLGNVNESVGPFALHVLTNKLQFDEPTRQQSSESSTTPLRVRPGYVIVASTEYQEDAPWQTSVLLHPNASPVYVVASRRAVVAPASFHLVATMYRSDLPSEIAVRIRLDKVQPLFPKRTLTDVLSSCEKVVKKREKWYPKVTDLLAQKLMAANMEGFENVYVLEARSWLEYQMVLMELLLAAAPDAADSEEDDMEDDVTAALMAAVSRFCQFLGVPQVLHPRELMSQPASRAALDDDVISTSAGGQWSTVPKAHRPSGRRLMQAGILCMLQLHAKTLARRLSDARVSLEKSKNDGIGSLAPGVSALGSAIDDIEEFVIQAGRGEPLGVRLDDVQDAELVPQKENFANFVRELIEDGKSAAALHCLSSVDSMLREGIAPTPSARAEVQDAEMLSARIDAIEQSVDMEIRDPKPVLGTPYTRHDIKGWSERVWAAVKRDGQQQLRGHRKSTKTALVDGILTHSTLYGADAAAFFVANPQTVIVAQGHVPQEVTLVLGLADVTYLGRCGIHIFETDRGGGTAPASLTNARLVHYTDCSSIPASLTFLCEPGRRFVVIPSMQALDDASAEPIAFTISATFFDEDSSGAIEFADDPNAATVSSVSQMIEEKRSLDDIHIALQSITDRIRRTAVRDLANNSRLYSHLMASALRYFVLLEKMRLGVALNNRDWRAYCNIAQRARSTIASAAALLDAADRAALVDYADTMQLIPEAMHTAANIALGINVEYQNVDPSEGKALLLSILHAYLAASGELNSKYCKDSRLPTNVEKAWRGTQMPFQIDANQAVPSTTLELVATPGKGFEDKFAYVVVYTDDNASPTLLDGVSFDLNTTSAMTGGTDGTDDSGGVVVSPANRRSLTVLCDGFRSTSDADAFASSLPSGAFAIARVPLAEDTCVISVRPSNLCAGILRVVVCTPNGITWRPVVTRKPKASSLFDIEMPFGGPTSLGNRPSALYHDMSPIFVLAAGARHATLRLTPTSPDVEVSLRVYEIADDAEESVLRSDGVALAFSSDIGGVAMRRIALNESKRHLLVPWVISSAESTSVRLEAWSSTEVRRVR